MKMKQFNFIVVKYNDGSSVLFQPFQSKDAIKKAQEFIIEILKTGRVAEIVKHEENIDLRNRVNHDDVIKE